MRVNFYLYISAIFIPMMRNILWADSQTSGYDIRSSINKHW